MMQEDYIDFDQCYEEKVEDQVQISDLCLQIEGQVVSEQVVYICEYDQEEGWYYYQIIFGIVQDLKYDFVNKVFDKEDVLGDL